MKNNDFIRRIKEFLPGFMSILRILLSPLILLSGIIGSGILNSILILICVASDYLDGKLYRMWDVPNKFKFSVDALGDKIFIIASALSLLILNPTSLIPLPLELGIGIVNAKSYFEGYKPRTNKYGQIKQAFLYLTYFSYSLATFIPMFKNISLLLSIPTVSLQTAALVRYINKYNEKKKEVMEDENIFINTLETDNKDEKQKSNNLLLVNKKDNDIERKIEELKKLKECYIVKESDKLNKVFCKQNDINKL